MVEYYDCILEDNVPYCRRPGFPIHIHQHDDTHQCHNNGKLWYFEKLRDSNSSINQMLSSSRVSLEKAEEYSLFLSGHIKNGSLCECKKQSFGNNCEYRFINNGDYSTFRTTREWQNRQKQNNRLQMQIYQKPLCYTTVKCNYGLLCLDWRDICDGRQQCMHGTDEEACDLLEFNECEDNEYRCSNGMCIPDVYFLDGEYDCMDHSDEHWPFEHFRCGYQPDPFNCDEHICKQMDWSCGDGQCINEKNRYEWEEYQTSTAQCHSMREYMFMCELSKRYKLWTTVNGTCHQSFVILPINELWHAHNQTTEADCLYLVKCALLGIDNTNCSQYIMDWCPSTIQYPPKALLTPYLTANYYSNRQWVKRKQPDFYTLEGGIRCRGYYAHTNVNKNYQLNDLTDRKHAALDQIFCNHPIVLKDNLGPQIDSVCYSNMSNTLGKILSYTFTDVCKQCISKYRIRDGIKDCIGGEDEIARNKSACSSRVGRHRYHCSFDSDTCLMVKSLGDSVTHCIYGDDEFDSESGRSLSSMRCTEAMDESCRFIRQYVWKSRNSRNNTVERLQETTLPFRSYCNTFWDFIDKSDESFKTCKSWRCPRNQFRCDTHQCIPTEYVCDGEWDCDDASDELLNIDRLRGHNQLLNFTQLTKQCANISHKSLQDLTSVCDSSKEYWCIPIHFTSNLFKLHARPCINFSQIGDGKIDCYGGLDERNTLTHCSGLGQLGFALQCRSDPNRCIEDDHICSNNSRCPNVTNDLFVCENRPQKCSDANDFLCINGSCVKNSRCDGKKNCLFGEDEYWCKQQLSVGNRLPYRSFKQKSLVHTRKTFEYLDYPLFIKKPNIANIQERRTLDTKNIGGKMTKKDSSLLCHRGVAVLYHTNTSVCLCPPSYYGDYCEYHSDRITSYVHFNVSLNANVKLTIDKDSVIKILALLIQESQIIHNTQFYTKLSFQTDRINKGKCYLLYSRASELLKHKIQRRLNRINIINQTSFYVRYEAYNMKTDSSMDIIGVWQYPVFFHFLPSFRLSKTLYFFTIQSKEFYSPCQSNPCKSPHAECHVLQNDPVNYVCLCKPGYSGEYCLMQDPRCANNFCHSKSLCYPDYVGRTGGSRLPFCLCPLNVYGTRCGLVYDPCSSHPCQNNGTCYPNPSDYTIVYCKCDQYHSGQFCTSKQRAIDIPIRTNNVSGPSVVQYFNVDYNTLDLTYVQQNVFMHTPNRAFYRYAGQFAPNIVLLKVFSSINAKYPQIYLLSLKFLVRNVNTPVELADNNTCLNVNDILEDISVYQYHDFCRNKSSLLDRPCFFDDQYICFCEIDNYRAECFIYNHWFDRCDKCLSKGRCIRGDLNKDEQLCLCPTCYYGHRCEFSIETFGFSLELLIIDSRQIIKVLYSILTFLIMIIGIFNNFCSMITFKLRSFKESSIGSLLFTLSLINSLALFVLFIKFMQITLRISDVRSCKFLAYLLPVITRSTFWLISWITMSRLVLITFPMSTLLKSKRPARIMTAVTLLALLGMHTHEIIYYTNIQHIPTNIMICAPNYNDTTILFFNRISTLIHYLGPFSIQVFSITFLIILIARSRDRTVRERKAFRQILREQLHIHKDQYIVPTIIILSALPQMILTFSFACTELSTALRHILLFVYLVSYMPQLLGFLLFVLPSTAYKSEFRKTFVGTRLYNLIDLKDKKTTATAIRHR